MNLENVMAIRIKGLAMAISCMLFPFWGFAQGPIENRLVYSEVGMEDISAEVKEYMIWDDTLSLKAHYYVPEEESSEQLPAVIFINIGGMNVPEWGVYKDWAKLVANNGMVGILYQATNGNSEVQTQTLLDYIQNNSTSLNIDKHRLAIWASSANATVGLPILWDTNNRMIKSAVFYYGIMNGGKPVRNDIPLFIVRSGQDAHSINKTIDNFVLEAINNDLKFTFINYVEGRHAFDVYDDTEESHEIIKETVAFLEKTLITNADETFDPTPTPTRILYQVKEYGIQEVLQKLDGLYAAKPDAFILQENNLVQVGNEILADSNAAGITWYKWVKDKYPGSSRSAYNLGSGYEKMDEKSKALKHYREALELVEEDPSVFSSTREFILREARKKISELK